jgi:hypothetical protein
LEHFPSRWDDYAGLHMSIYNASPDALVISISIHDDQHSRTGRLYSDRFSASFTLRRGWNDIEIPLDRVRNAPQDRALDLGTVRDLSIVATALPEPRVIHVDDIRLTR